MLNMLFPQTCPDCQAIDKCGEDCFCPTCRAAYYERPVNPVELSAWKLLAPTIRAIDERWRTDSSGPICTFSSGGHFLRDYELEINCKHATYIISTNGHNVSVVAHDERGEIFGAHYALEDYRKVAHDVDL